MTIWEIDKGIESCFDEDGTLIDIDKFESLQLSREEKLENTALLIKNLKAESTALANEEANLKARREAVENRIKSVTELLKYASGGEGFKTPRVSVSYRKGTPKVLLDDDFVEWAEKSGHNEYLKYKTPEPNKALIKDALKDGEKILHAELVNGEPVLILK